MSQPSSSSHHGTPVREDGPEADMQKETAIAKRFKKIAHKPMASKGQKEGKKFVRNKDARVFRSSLKTMLTLLDDVKKDGGRLPEPVIVSLKHTGFYNFVEVFYKNKVGTQELAKVSQGLEKLIGSYVEDEYGIGYFELSTTVKIAPSVGDMAAIFGLPLKDDSEDDAYYRRLIMEKQQQPTPPASLSLCRDHFRRLLANSKGKHAEVTNKEVREKFFELLQRLRDGDSAVNPDDLAKLIIFHLCQTVFFTKSGGSNLPYRFLALVDSIEVISSICWPRLILEYVMESIKRTTSKTKWGNYSDAYSKMEGCTIYFLYWFAEHSTLVERKSAPIREYPRFYTWNGYEISVFLKSDYHIKMRSKQIFKDLVIAVGEEEGRLEEDAEIREEEAFEGEGQPPTGGDEDARPREEEAFEGEEQPPTGGDEDAEQDRPQQLGMNTLIEGSMQELEDLRKENSKLLAENEKLNEKLKEVEAELDQQRALNVVMEGSVPELEELRRENEKLQKKLKELEEQGGQQIERNTSMEVSLRELDSLRREKAEIIAENEKLIENCKELQAQVQITEQLREKNERLIIEKRKLQQQVDSLQEEARRKDGTIADLKAMAELLQDQEIQGAAEQQPAEYAAPKAVNKRGGGAKRGRKAPAALTNKKQKITASSNPKPPAMAADEEKVLRKCDDLRLWGDADEELKTLYRRFVSTRSPLYVF